MINNSFMKVWSSVSLDMIILIIDITLLINNFIKLLSSLSMSTLTINIFMKVLSSLLLMAITVFTTSQGCSTTPLSAAGNDPGAAFCLWELLFFPEYRICFCFQFLVVGRLCVLHDSLLHLLYTSTVKIVLIILTIIQTNAQGARKIPPTPDLLLLQVVSALEAAQEAALLLAWVFPF